MSLSECCFLFQSDRRLSSSERTWAVGKVQQSFPTTSAFQHSSNMLSYSHFKDPVFDPGFILIVNGCSQSHQHVLFSLPAGMHFPHVCCCVDCAVCFTPAQLNVCHGLNMPMTLCKVSLCTHCLGKVHLRITTPANYTLNTINN